MTATTSLAAATPALQLQDAEISVGGRQILSDVSITVARGEFIAVLGEPASRP